MLAISLCPSCFQQTHAQDTHQTTLYTWTCGSHGSYRSELSTTIMWNAKNELPIYRQFQGEKPTYPRCLKSKPYVLCAAFGAGWNQI